ncbi:hypothetical protein E2C01_087949 [Portunus trituberculatus]|uniref:Uncharacterized protein n=1 Tax=Portunus trituberculatus TaxID=210409 RepID=A0A5B7JD72_PORTR|nr:hypothetical protein [Portunus trituberculatus]
MYRKTQLELPLEHRCSPQPPDYKQSGLREIACTERLAGWLAGGGRQEVEGRGMREHEWVVGGDACEKIEKVLGGVGCEWLTSEMIYMVCVLNQFDLSYYFKGCGGDGSVVCYEVTRKSTLLKYCWMTVGGGNTVVMVVVVVVVVVVKADGL